LAKDEDEEESEEELREEKSGLSRAAIGILGGIFTVVSVFAFLRASR